MRNCASCDSTEVMTGNTARYNVCSQGARVRYSTSSIEFVEGVCLPLLSVLKNFENGFEFGESPYEQQYNFMWGMGIMEHGVILLMLTLGMLLAQSTMKLDNEIKGQARWLEEKIRSRTYNVDVEQRLQRGRCEGGSYLLSDI